MAQPETLVKALDERGWTQKKLIDPKTGRVCMSGALAEVGFKGGAQGMAKSDDPTNFKDIPKVKLLIEALMRTAPKIDGMPKHSMMADLSQIVWTNDRLTEEEARAWAARADAAAASCQQEKNESRETTTAEDGN